MINLDSQNAGLDIQSFYTDFSSKNEIKVLSSFKNVLYRPNKSNKSKHTSYVCLSVHDSIYKCISEITRVSLNGLASCKSEFFVQPTSFIENHVFPMFQGGRCNESYITVTAVITS